MYPYLFDGRNDLTSGFQLKTRPGHNGGDIVGRDSNKIHALEGGKVLQSRIVTNRANLTWQWGWYLSILGESTGDTWFYCHQAQKPFFTAGQIVKEGEIIGIMGNTGYSFGTHTHLERRRGNKAINPFTGTGYQNVEKVYLSSAKPSQPEIISSLSAMVIDPMSQGDLNRILAYCKEASLTNQVSNSQEESLHGNPLYRIVINPVSSGDQIKLIEICRNANLRYELAPLQGAA